MLTSLRNRGLMYFGVLVSWAISACFGSDKPANPNLSSLDRAKRFSADFLITYLLHPGTALYIGYNSDLQNYDRSLCRRLADTSQCDPNGPGLIRDPNGFMNDGRLFFVKVSYLFRP